MIDEPRTAADYSARQVGAARRVLVDVGQVLASFRDVVVVVGGWVPDLLHPGSSDHSGSIDVDLALDAAHLGEGRYAEILKLLISTGRYAMGPQHFQLAASIDLADGLPPVQVSVDFLAPADVKLTKNRPRLLEHFRVLQVASCATAFRHPQEVEITGRMITGARNTVRLCVAAMPDFLLMKAHAIGLRDKPKDVYDLCYCLDDLDGLAEVGADWRARSGEPVVREAIRVLTEKFGSVDAFGPQQLVAFHAADGEEAERLARRAYDWCSG